MEAGGGATSRSVAILAQVEPDASRPFCRLPARPTRFEPSEAFAPVGRNIVSLCSHHPAHAEGFPGVLRGLTIGGVRPGRSALW